MAMTNDLPIEKTISTDRLMLEMITVDDAGFIQSLVNTKEWIEYIGDRHVRSRKDAIAYINKILVTENFLYWIVRIKEINTAIGIISFLKRAYLEYFDIGFAFLPEFTGKGYAVEAAKAVLDRVTRRHEFKTVLALTLASNKKSIRLLEKLGFKFEKASEWEDKMMEIYTNATSGRPKIANGNFSNLG
jgi:ribosomal-protein-alanine N-acetyltransferase